MCLRSPKKINLLFKILLVKFESVNRELCEFILSEVIKKTLTENWALNNTYHTDKVEIILNYLDKKVG